MRRTGDPLSLFRQLEARPYGFDFFQALRRIECLFPSKPRLGAGQRPADEPVRLAQEPSLSFAPATLSSFELPKEGRPARMEVRFLGLLGPNGPLPLHLTEYARERMLHEADRTFPRFLDVFNHRFLALFYRAWAQAQPTVNLDRPGEDRFAAYVGSSFGLASPRLINRDAVSDFAKLFFAGQLVRQVRNKDGLAAMLGAYFRVPVAIEEFVGHWMKLPERERTRLGGVGAVLGRGAVAGASVWDRQHKFRIWLGPLTLATYEGFLPGGTAIGKLLAWVRQYLCFELEWDARLVLAKGEVPKSVLGKYGRLGWTTWLGERARDADAVELVLDPERLMRGRRTTTMNA
jgi:type VI secretion system protein ImpH